METTVKPVQTACGGCSRRPSSMRRPESETRYNLSQIHRGSAKQSLHNVFLRKSWIGLALIGLLTINIATIAVAAEAVPLVDPPTPVHMPIQSTRNAFNWGWYTAVYGGVSFPEKVTSVRGTGTTVTDMNLSRSALGGGKLGYYFKDAPWLGLELDAFYTAPGATQQQVSARRTGSTFNSTAAGSSLQVATGSLNVMVRYPGELFQPYVGVGPALVYVNERDPLRLQTDALRLGANAMAGSRVILTEQLWLFAEYKWDYAQLQFDSVRVSNSQSTRVSGSYAIHNATAGIGFSF